MFSDSDDAFSPLESEMKNWDSGTLLGKTTGSMLVGSAAGEPDQFVAVDQLALPEPLVQVRVTAAASLSPAGASAAAPSASANNRPLLARVRAARAVIWLVKVNLLRRFQAIGLPGELAEMPESPARVKWKTPAGIICLLPRPV